MKAFSLSALLLLFTVVLLGQGETTTLTVRAGDCGANLQLYKFTGFNFEPLVPLMRGPDGEYSVTLPGGEPVFRYVGSSPKDAIAVILGADKEVTVSGECGNLREASVSGSDINAAYLDLRGRFDDFQERYSTLIQDIQVIEDARVNAEARAAMGVLDEEKRQLIGQMQSLHPLLGRVVALNTYLSYYSADTTIYANELEHYLGTYFHFVDFSDPGYDDLSWTYDAGRGLASNLLHAVPGQELGVLLLSATEPWPGGGGARFLARSGALSSLLGAEHPGALPLADSILAEFGNAYPGPAAAIRNAIYPLRLNAVGSEAPLFSGLSPKGDTIALAGLRGKTVLLDFWASWCAPCRRENPNVVRMYERFKEHDFEILGISLDDRRERWEGAIAADGLEWLHVSDLQGWSSPLGRLYGVTSIPQTLLLDAEGKIIARNLRGPELERKLEEVLLAAPNKR